MDTYKCDFFEKNEQTPILTANLSHVPSMRELISFDTSDYGLLTFRVNLVRNYYPRPLLQGGTFQIDNDYGTSFEFSVERVENNGDCLDNTDVITRTC